MKLVFVESPYAGDVSRNIAYARACLADCLRRGEAPYASHLLYTQPGVLRDEVPGERRHGIEAGLQFASACELVAAYVDLGVSPGMRDGLDRHAYEGRTVEKRHLPPDVLAEVLAGTAVGFLPFPLGARGTR